MIDWIKLFLDPVGSTQELKLHSDDFEIEREKPKFPESRHINESGKVTKGPDFTD